MKLKLQDFAREKGVTDRAIQKHIQNHLPELLDHIERRGPKGTWLDEYAQEFISNLMYETPTAILDTELVRKYSELEDKYRGALEELSSARGLLSEIEDIRARLAASEAAQELLKDDRDFHRAAAEKAQERVVEVVTEREKAIADAERVKMELDHANSKIDDLLNRNWLERLTRRGE